MATNAADRSDAELVRRAAQGEREAFAAIYQRHHAVVYRFARMMSGSPSLAEDVTQEVFMALLRDLPRYEPQRSGLPTYLYGVARNVTRGLLRRERRFVRMDVVGTEAPEPAIADDPSGALQATETLGRLRRAILGLPSRYREVVILCDVHGLTYADAATALRLPVGTVRSRLHRGRQSLGDRLRTTGGEAAAATTIKRCLA